LPDSGGPSDGGSTPTVDGGIPYTGPTTAGTVTVARSTTLGKLPAGYAGFSFEKSHLTNGWFTGTNAPLIALFKLLGSGGFLRLGGGDVDNHHWLATAPAVTGGNTSTDVGTADVDGLAAFLSATGWQVLYGMNLQSETTPDADVGEATYAASKLGTSLHAFELGNEWSGTSLQTRWETFYAAIQAAVPNAPFAGPEGCCGTAYSVSFAQAEASKILLVTYHHYVSGAALANATVATLLATDTGLITDTKTMVAAATANNIAEGFRWGEINTFSGHGKQGVSDAYVSALWGVDDMLTGAQLGAVGVNYHGGGENENGNVCTNGPTSCTKPFRYSPIDEANGQVTGAAPLYYAMLFISRAGTGTLLSTTPSFGTLNVTAYSILQSDGSTNVVIVNKDQTNGLNASVDVGAPVTTANALYLQGPSLTSTTGVTFAGAGVSATGDWTPNPAYALSAQGNAVTVVVPPISAVLVHAQ
jgi:hypothetical protein